MRTRRDVLRAGGAIAGALLAPGCSSPSQVSRTTASDPLTGTATPVGPAPTASTITPAKLPAEVEHGPRDRPRVALTFHGQGPPTQLDNLLGALERAGVHGTVLAVGSWLRQYPAVARRILDGRHELGNHTQNHLALATMAPAAVFGEIDACAKTLTDLTGSPGIWFRASQTRRTNATIRAQAAKAGYPTCLSYDLDSLDYTDPGPAAVVARTLRAVRNGSIISLHGGHPGTITAMPALLDGLASRGLRPVTVTELMAP